jgi:hypothetical protein
VEIGTAILIVGCLYVLGKFVMDVKHYKANREDSVWWREHPTRPQ